MVPLSSVFVQAGAPHDELTLFEKGWRRIAPGRYGMNIIVQFGPYLASEDVVLLERVLLHLLNAMRSALLGMHVRKTPRHLVQIFATIMNKGRCVQQHPMDKSENLVVVLALLHCEIGGFRTEFFLKVFGELVCLV